MKTIARKTLVPAVLVLSTAGAVAPVVASTGWGAAPAVASTQTYYRTLPDLHLYYRG